MSDYEYIHHLLHDDPNTSTAAAATIAFVLARTGGNPLVPGSISWPLEFSGDMGFRPDGIGNDLVDFSTTGSGIFVDGTQIPGVPPIATIDSGGFTNFAVNDSDPGHESGPTVGIVNRGANESLQVADGTGAELIVGPLTSGTVGFLIGRALSAPPDTDLQDSQFVLWLDDTPGLTFLNIKAKDSAGTVRTATIALT